MELFWSLLSQYGALVVGSITFLSCLAMPVPASLVMLGSGAFAASGDMSLLSVSLAAFTGATLGDQTGFHLGRRGAAWLDRMSHNRPSTLEAINKARAYVQKNGGLGVFFSRWLFSPLGPYVNFVSGAAAQPRMVFTIAATMGEAIWVSVYIGLGYSFGDHISAIATIAGNTSGFLAAMAITIGLAVMLLNRIKKANKR